MDIDDNNQTTEFSAVKHGTNKLFKNKDETDSKNMRKIIDNQVETVSKVAILGALRFYYHVYKTVLTGSMDQIKAEFEEPVQKDATKATAKGTKTEAQLKPIDKVEGHFMCAKNGYKNKKYPPMNGFKALIDKYAITTDKVKLHNSLKYVARLYATVLKKNIQEHAYNRLRNIFRHILNKSIGAELSSTDKKKKMKCNNRVVYVTLKHFFERDENEMDLDDSGVGDELDISSDDDELEVCAQLENMLIDYHSESDSDYDESFNADENDHQSEFESDGEHFEEFSEMEVEVDEDGDELPHLLTADGVHYKLIDFVKHTLRPYNWNVGSIGKGVFYGINHPCKFYSYIPVFIRLQQFIENENKNKQLETQIRSFIVLPTFRYGVQHIHIDTNDLFLLYNAAGLNKKMSNGIREFPNLKDFNQDKNQFGIAKKWFELFNLKESKSKKTPMSFAGRISTNGIDVSISVG